MRSLLQVFKKLSKLKSTKMIKTSFSVKSTHWHKDESNCKMNEVMKKTKTISQVKFNESLNLTYVYSR